VLVVVVGWQQLQEGWLVVVVVVVRLWVGLVGYEGVRWDLLVLVVVELQGMGQQVVVVLLLMGLRVGC
jgi:hypothetical protein